MTLLGTMAGCGGGGSDGSGGGASLVSIALAPVAPSAAAGSLTQMSATGTYTDGTHKILTSQVSWASSNKTVATINAAGVASALTPGSTTLSGSLQGIEGMTSLTVTKAALVSIQITPSKPSIPNGLTQQLTATGTFADHSTQNLTTLVTWTSSSTAVATVSNATGSKGLATSVTQGSTTITASQGAISGVTTLTVGAAVPVSLVVTPANPSVTTLLSLRTAFTATVLFSDRTTIDSTPSAIWSTSNNSVGTISVSNFTQCAGLSVCPLGVVTSVGVGTTLITAVATWNSVTVSGSTTLTVTANQSQWDWVGGSKSAGASGVYGTLGTAAAGNVPGARDGAVSWTDFSTGYLWLLGGYGLDSAGAAGYLNDLWTYNPATAQWTWRGGANTAGALDGTVPGARSGAVSWMADQYGDLGGGIFWIFGGKGLDSAGTQGYLADLWSFVPATGWSLLSGTESANYLGNCQVASVSPGARSGSISWPVGNVGSNFLYLFGGYGYTCNGAIGLLNDLWVFEPTGPAKWEQIGGSMSPGASGVYGNKGVAGSGNTPGARMGSASFADHSGNLWLFGGTGLDSTGTQGNLNDLWKYNKGVWTWVSGSNLVGASGVYGTQSTAASGNVPGARNGAVSWTDAVGNLWLFGGTGLDSTGAVGNLNDLWVYNPATALWTWVRGSNIVGASGSYGMEGTPGPGNTPGSRYGSVPWIDGTGNLWLFGGDGLDATGTPGYLNDLWQF
jgi:N-acetylneuraminic acid mutarotase